LKKYYSLVTENNEANIYIYGDITSWEWLESDVSSYTLAREIEGLEVNVINVYINSYGGEVAEGLAIFTALKRHKAKVRTHGDGFICSAAVLPFAAGDERIMSIASLLLVHNVWLSYVSGNANDLRKQADDLETITQASINAFMSIVNISEDELKEMIDNETWILPQQALEMGFATSIVNDNSSNKASQSVRKALFAKIIGKEQGQKSIPTKPKPEEKNDPDLLQSASPNPEPPALAPEPPVPDPEPEPEPQENKTMKFMAALFR